MKQRSTGLTQPYGVDALLVQAVTLLKQDKPRRALRILLKAKAKARHNALIYYNLGLAYEAIKQYRRALNCYQKALLYDPTLADAAVCQGYILGLQGHIKLELARYDEVLRRDPTHAIALYNKAVTLNDDLDNVQAAIPLYLRVLKQPLNRKQHRSVCVRLVYAYLDTGQYRKAAHILRKLIQK